MENINNPTAGSSRINIIQDVTIRPPLLCENNILRRCLVSGAKNYEELEGSRESLGDTSLLLFEEIENIEFADNWGVSSQEAIIEIADRFEDFATEEGPATTEISTTPQEVTSEVRYQMIGEKHTRTTSPPVPFYNSLPTARSTPGTIADADI